MMVEKNQIFLHGITLEEVNSEIQNGFKEQLKGLINIRKPPITNEYLTRQEVARKLSISLPTLNDWSKKGILKSYRIGNRVLYKSSEIEQSLKPINP